MWVPKRPVPIKHDVGALITQEWITRTDLTGVILQKKSEDPILVFTELGKC